MGENKRERMNKRRSLFEYVKGGVENIEKEMNKNKMEETKIIYFVFFLIIFFR